MFDELRGLQGQEFDLDGLVDAVNRQIVRAGWSPEDDRVSGRLDARTVRYYQTLGLVSKPVRYDGRQAVYGYQHLLQLVAVKALQAQGLSLGQIQGWLPAQPVEALQMALAGSLSEGRRPPLAASPAAPPAPAVMERAERRMVMQPEAAHSLAPEPAGLAAFRVAPGITLLIDPQRVANPQRTAQTLQRLLEEMD